MWILNRECPSNKQTNPLIQILIFWKRQFSNKLHVCCEYAPLLNIVNWKLIHLINSSISTTGSASEISCSISLLLQSTLTKFVLAATWLENFCPFYQQNKKKFVRVCVCVCVCVSVAKMSVSHIVCKWWEL